MDELRPELERHWNGYGALLQALAGALDRQRADVRLSTVVREVHWQRGDVAIDTLQHGGERVFRAPRAIVTLPLGVLQLPAQAPNAVRFVPAVTAKQEALAGLAAGPVIKVLLQFRQAFWESIDGGRYRDAAFFHAPRAQFPTFWTMLPVRAALLAAWAAGPAAARLAGIGESEIIRHVLDRVDELFAGAARVRAELESVPLHDWQADSFACGAYSYVVAGGGAARKQLAASPSNRPSVPPKRRRQKHEKREDLEPPEQHRENEQQLALVAHVGEVCSNAAESRAEIV